MDMKKILLVALIAVAIVASVSVVSAGWFDFLGSGDESLNNYTISGSVNVTNANIKIFDWNYEKIETTYDHLHDDLYRVNRGGTEGHLNGNVTFELDLNDIDWDEPKGNTINSDKDLNKAETKDFVKNNIADIIEKSINNKDGWEIKEATIMFTSDHPDGINFDGGDADLSDNFTIKDNKLIFSGQFTLYDPIEDLTKLETNYAHIIFDNSEISSHIDLNLKNITTEDIKINLEK